jgi:DNA-binding NarL/FixJ family response regulator
MPASVLIVDDSPELADVLEFLIQTDSRFVHVGTAKVADEALALAREHDPAVIVLDHMMPDVTGEEALPELRDACPNATIVMFSAVANERLAESTRGLVDACVLKTTGLGELLDLIADLREGRRPAD